MKRKLAIERTYKISDYNGIRLSDEVSEIPDKVALNPQAVSKIYELLQLNIELNYNKYLNLSDKMSQYTREIVLAELEAMKAQTMDDLRELFQKIGD